MRDSRDLLLCGLVVLTFGCSTQTSDNSTSKELLQKTVTSTTSSATCEGWEVHDSDEFRCRIGLPENATLSNGMIHSEVNKPTYTFESSERDGSFQTQQIADDTENYLRGFDRVIVSENLDVGDGMYCRAFAHQGGSITQLGRIYINEETVWVITATRSNDEPWDPGLEFFFDHFQPKP